MEGWIWKALCNEAPFKFGKNLASSRIRTRDLGSEVGSANRSATRTLLAIASKGIILSRQRTTKVLIRLRGCAGWSAPLLFAYGINRFYHDMAHIWMVRWIYVVTIHYDFGPTFLIGWAGNEQFNLEKPVTSQTKIWKKGWPVEKSQQLLDFKIYMYKEYENKWFTLNSFVSGSWSQDFPKFFFIWNSESCFQIVWCGRPWAIIIFTIVFCTIYDALNRVHTRQGNRNFFKVREFSGIFMNCQELKFYHNVREFYISVM